MTQEETEKEIRALRREIDRMTDENIRYRRTMEDLLLNLEAENMPTVATSIRKVGEKAAQITEIRQQVTEQGAQLDAIARTVGTDGENIAQMQAQTEENGARIALLVGGGSGGRYIRSAEIVSAINSAGSSIRIAADKINFEGSDVTFSTDRLAVDSQGCVRFSAPITVNGLYVGTVVCEGRLDLSSANGETGYVYLGCGEDNQLELTGDGGVRISTASESGTDASEGNIEMWANRLTFNGKQVLTRSSSDLSYLRQVLGV